MTSMGVAIRLSLAVAMILCAGLGVAHDGFVQREGDRLLLDGSEFRFVGWNVPNLCLVEDALGYGAASPWRWPTEYEITDALESARQMGGTVVRPYVISVRRDNSDAGDRVHVLGPGQFNEEAFRALDLVLRVAGEKGVRVIVPLVDNWKWWGGAAEYAGFRGKPPEAFWTDDEVIADFERTVDFVVMRVNSLTGVAYRDDPAIFAWETGNELDAPPEWTARIAARLKRLDPNHLVIDGRALHGVPETSLVDPHVDVVTTHHYPNVGNNNAEAVRREAAKARGKRPYFVGEFGFMPPDEAERLLDAVIEEGCVGALYWSLRFHREEGGFYWHSEYASDGLFKAFHWPGFDSGEPYEERRVVNLVRDRAFRIRGLPVPPIATPAPPETLPITPPGLLSWRGSAGASHYVVERADSSGGPWRVVDERVSDAAVQNRPLWADEAALAGSAHWYRVRAANSAGASAPSELVGPMRYDHRILVDELAGDTRLAELSAGAFVAQGARACGEDAHRLRLEPGGSFTYRVDAPIDKVRVWLYAEREGATLEASAADGSDLPLTREAAGGGANDYGYLREVVLEVNHASETPLVRFTRPADAEGDLQVSRVEIEYGGE